NTPEDAQAKQDQLRILIAGVGGKGHPGSFLTDTLIVAEIDNTTNSINLISIPRDLLVYTEDGYYQKINSVYT
ncbi:MAG: LCP family protein, partial [Candidatus Paceibacteria bacterium]